MKYSELKPGDCFQLPHHGNNRATFLVLDNWRRKVLKSGTAEGGKLDAGETVAADPNNEGRDVELVPMPGPYTVGKEYRRRNGQRVVHTGPTTNYNAHNCPHFFHSVPHDPKEHGSVSNGGYFSGHDIAPSDLDIMGEWREETAKPRIEVMTWDPGVGCAPAFTHMKPTTTNQESTPPMSTKRTLPTVTLDQIFETLKEKGACWYKDLGPLRLAKKLETVVGRFGDSHKPFSLYDLHLTVMNQDISIGDAGWLINNMGPALTPRDLNATGQTVGTPAFAVLLNEWENPKPKYQPKAVLGTEIPLGGLFRRQGSPGEVFVRIPHETEGTKGPVRFIWVKGGPNDTERIGGTDGVSANRSYVLIRHVGSSGSHSYEDIMEQV